MKVNANVILPWPNPVIPTPAPIGTYPPKNGNPGIVPPWLQKASTDYEVWVRDSADWDYEPGSSPFDYGLTVDEVANMYRTSSLSED